MRAKRCAALLICGTLCFGGCGGGGHEEVANEQQQPDKQPRQHEHSPQGTHQAQQQPSDQEQQRQSSPPQPVTDPVREANRIPDEAKKLFGWKHQDAAHHLRMAFSSYGTYDARGKTFGWSSVGWWDQVFDENNPRHCYQVALSNLIVGRFDTASSVLERRLASAPQSDPHNSNLAALLEEARLVRQVLTEARDALRKQDPALEYPDEAIFLAVQFSEPNEFLALNVADAHLAAFPESKAALRRAGELSLQVAERDYADPDRTTNVPERRRDWAQFWGQSILEQLHAMDPQDSYPVIRMMAYELRRPEPRGLDLDFFKGAFDNYDNRTDLTNAEKGFLQYGRAMLLLNQKDGWGVPTADVVIRWLVEATKWDPETTHYAAVLEQVRANEDAINQMKLAQRESDTNDSTRLNELLRRNGKVNPREVVETAFWDVTRNLMVLEHKTLQEKDPARAKLLEMAPCTFCLGTGQDYALKGALDRKCPACNGTGRFPHQ